MPAAIGEPTEPINSTHLDTLDDFSLLSVLDEVKMVDLINLAAMNNRFSQLIADHIITFKYLSAEREVFIEADNHLSMWYREDKTSLPFITNTTEEVFSALQYFGHLFKHLHINIHLSGRNYVNRLQFLINKHCSDAFQQIQLSHVTVNDMNLSFNNASVVRIDVESRNSGFILPLDKTFPRLKSLRINSEIHINQHFPHLEKISLGLYDQHQLWVKPNLQLVFNFMRSNPQLRSFQSEIPNDATFLTALDAFLPNLEELSVTLLLEFLYDVESWPIARLRNVRHFTLKTDMSPWTHSPMLESIQFDHLESFHVTYFYEPQIDFVIGLIVNNTALKNVVVNSELSFQQLTRLITSLEELKELTIAWDAPPRGVVIKNFLDHVIASNHKLAKLSIHVNCNLVNIRKRQELLESISRDWSFSEEQTRDSPTTLQIFRSN